MTCSAAPCGSASPWQTFGLPGPTVDGYAYQVDAGVVRTQFDDGSIRQRRRHPRGRRTYRLRWSLDSAALQTLELFLAAYGADWFVCPTPAGDLTLRIIDAPDVRADGYDRFLVGVAAESAAAT